MGQNVEPTLPANHDEVSRRYRIRVVGRLGPEWADLTNGMVVSVVDGPGGRVATELTGPVIDGAALMGILERLYNHGARLLDVESLDGN